MPEELGSIPQHRRQKRHNTTQHHQTKPHSGINNQIKQNQTPLLTEGEFPKHPCLVDFPLFFQFLHY
jgi:hypothetical protein